MVADGESARQAAIFDSVIDAIVTADSDGRILTANAAAEEMFGHRRDDMAGELIAHVLVPPELRERQTKGLRRYVETGEETILGRRVRVEAMRVDGSVFPVELTVTRADADAAMQFTAVIRDMSEERRSEEEWERLLEAEQAARESAERAWWRLRLVSDASELLAASLDYPGAFEKLAARIVVDFADLCLIDVSDSRGNISRVAAVHHDPLKQPIADRLRTEYAPIAGGEHPAAGVVHSAKSRFAPVMSDEFLRSTCRDEEHFRLVRELGFESYMCVPLITRGRILGALTLVSTHPRRRYGETDVAIAQEIARRASVRIDNARLYQERDRIAHALQQGLLPRRLPDVPMVDLAARYFPAGEAVEAGGDFYDAYASGAGSWDVVIGDVCGKGPEAAAVMGLARSTLRALARSHRTPKRLLEALNAELLDQVEETRFVTVAYARLQPDPGAGSIELRLCLGGHPPALLVAADGAVTAVGRPGTLLGMFADVRLREERIQLHPGQTLLLYTDGLSDESGSLAAMVERDLRRFLADHRALTAEQIAQQLENEVRSHPQSALRDDIAYVVLRVASM
ncbi:MAG: SpoIIE family protein phosphatase [Gaiellales bacterium]